MPFMSRLLLGIFFFMQAWVLPVSACDAINVSVGHDTAIEVSALDDHHQAEQHPCNDNCNDCSACHTHTHTFAPQVSAAKTYAAVAIRALYSAPSVATHQTSPPIKPPSLS